MTEEPINEQLQAEISASMQEEQSKELQEISELSKRGYQYLKENRIEEAEECFSRILEKDRENNYALVGLGDAARKRLLDLMAERRIQEVDERGRTRGLPGQRGGKVRQPFCDTRICIL